MRIAIVGAGPSGAVALDAFLDAGFTDIVVFERNRVVGGTWNLDDQLGVTQYDPVPGIDSLGQSKPIPVPAQAVDGTPTRPVAIARSGPDAYEYRESALYPQVETNVVAELMAFTKKPFPKIHPPKTLERFGVDDAYRTHDVVRDYVVSYFQGREQFVRLEHSVAKAWQPKGPGSFWRLVVRKPSSTEAHDEWYVQDFDFLYVAVGHFSVPNIPQIKGLQEAVHRAPRGAILHTKTFRDPTLYKGKRVVLLGAGFSNVDVVQLIQNAGAHLPLHLSLQSVLPVAISGFAQPWIDTHPPVTQVEVQSDSHLRITFEDGVVVNDIDTLILGTGYKYSYPFLKDYVAQYGGITSADGRRTQNLFWSTWWKVDPSLVISADITDSIFWRFIENQGKAAAGLWKRPRNAWPTLEQSEQWEADRNAKGLKDFHTWWPYFPELFRALAYWGNFDPGDTSIYLPLFEKGFKLKNQYWESQAQRWLETHPEDNERYERTRAYLEEHRVTKVGL